MKLLQVFIAHKIKGGIIVRKILLIVLSMAFMLFIAACGFEEDTGGDEGSNDTSSETSDSSTEGDTADDSGDQGNSINLFEKSEIPTMDSSHAHDGVAFAVLNNVNEGL